MYKGKYTTKKTAFKYGLDLRIDDFIEMMADFEKTVKVGTDYVEVFDAETGESMDIAHYVLMTGINGEKYGNLLLSEMESTMRIGEGRDDYASTVWNEIDVDGLPLCVR
jgi:hypothetical protein